VSAIPETITVDSHFAGKPSAIREIYERLLAVLKEIGPVQEDPKKSSIHLVRGSAALAGVEVRREYLLLNLKADHRIVSPRIRRTEQRAARRFHYKVKLSSPEEVDAETREWLEHASELSGK
jgi:Domain of unknown function (DUF5655)